jgi:hypothetical protein
MLEVALAMLGSADYFEPWLCWVLLIILSHGYHGVLGSAAHFESGDADLNSWLIITVCNPETSCQAS